MNDCNDSLNISKIHSFNINFPFSLILVLNDLQNNYNIKESTSMSVDKLINNELKDIINKSLFDFINNLNEKNIYDIGLDNYLNFIDFDNDNLFMSIKLIKAYYDINNYTIDELIDLFINYKLNTKLCKLIFKDCINVDLYILYILYILSKLHEQVNHFHLMNH